MDPVAGALVRICSLDQSFVAFTDSAGMASFDSVPYGSYWVKVLGPDFDRFRDMLTVDAPSVELVVQFEDREDRECQEHRDYREYREYRYREHRED